MAYLAPYFDVDVFVSYSHGDPRGDGSSPLKRWTVSLIRELQDEIQAVDTEFDNLGIWIDEAIDPTAHLTLDLRNKVKASGILLIVMSPRYLQSSWCKDELSWFREQVLERSTDQARVFVVRALPTNDADWPDFLRDERGNSPLGFRFYDPQSRMPYGWRNVRETSDEYVKQLWTLQTALTKRLRELRDRAKVRTAVPDLSAVLPGNGRRIYLHARAEDIGLRDQVRTQLSQDGLTLLSPPAETGMALSDWTQASRLRMEAAKRCAALALVRADHSDDRFVGDLLDIGIDERAQIQAARGTPLPCAVLDGSGESLPIDVAPYGIRRFDLGDQDWHKEFRAWVDAARPASAAAS